ncbi:tRNA (N(6)-L-threonylcarbamoyladenosine(37)-C(2))-methylthiotransferase MtaB [Halanaerobium sp. Z-7514]|uniref:Threonylcarbamoyladenosine tRNA methylthiotransferase MtaB n=1 Tax=Halanaerobium polyolivorans TaxID=2886943 RepID=A0AAW4X0R4_9FIRM|nr:tRNA (N(6)-L-threonylcarbamoyladenosine(37)-C(2))-methylthiotransferase MtaB [Halanaerobium polyolivorans]MCC3145398.1 tRNA (N(6)-L-threonylcarbamoyladenosine(37)-C(2))-methylthiotransferase MtaB [Halanaerobium polyolivorans]
MNKKAAFYTLGCKVNQYETEAIIDIFLDNDFEVVDFSDEADIYIINSCTVTNQAASKSRKIARRAKRSNNESLVAVVGCYSQAFPEEVSSISEIDFVMGSSDKAKIVKKVDKLLAGKEIENQIKDYQELKDYEELELKRLTNRTRANIKIEDGCNQFCSYCIIPYARGPVRSREQKSILKEVKKMVEEGVKEIILTGTHLGAYGSEKNNTAALGELLQELSEVENLQRLRLSSIEGTEIDSKMIDLMAEKDIFCPHLHLPLQSGSNKILKAMQRPYTAEEFAKTVNKIRAKIPDIAITTDVIVGFPGETQKTFEQTLELVKELKFTKVHVFPFSAREGTPAYKMDNKVNGNIIKKYSKKLRELNQSLMKEYQAKFLGQSKKVLIEEERDQQTGLLTGYTDNYLKVLLAGPDKIKNTLTEVELESSFDYSHIKGKIIE